MSTKATREDLAERSAEIERYLQHLKLLENETLKVNVGGKRYKGIDGGLRTTMRGAAYLLVYNIVEYTASSGLEAIFLHMKGDGTTFNGLSGPLKLVVLSHARKHSPETLVDKFADIATDIVSRVVDRAQLFSGNVDAKCLRDVAKKYGIIPKSAYRCDDLLTIKTRRNDLAHGAKSFAEAGRDSTTDEIVAAFKRVRLLLNDYLDDIDRFLASKQYLAV